MRKRNQTKTKEQQRRHKTKDAQIGNPIDTAKGQQQKGKEIKGNKEHRQTIENN